MPDTVQMASAKKASKVSFVNARSMFEAIRFIRDLATGKCFLGDIGSGAPNVVSTLDFTIWMKSDSQEFEVEFDINGQLLVYTIHLEQTESREPRIIKEIACCDGKELYSRDLSGVKFGNRSGFPLDWRQAALPSIQSANDDLKEIGLLQSAFANLVILQPNAKDFEAESGKESRFPNYSLDKFNIMVSSFGTRSGFHRCASRVASRGLAG